MIVYLVGGGQMPKFYKTFKEKMKLYIAGGLARWLTYITTV